MARIKTRHRTELNYAKRERAMGFTTSQSLSYLKRNAHKEERRNAKAIINEQLQEDG